MSKNTESPITVHYTSDGIVFDPKGLQGEARHRAEDMITQRETRQMAFYRYLDRAPNLNEKYDSEIELTHNYFAKQQLEIAPIVVLGAKEYDELVEICDPHNDNQDTLRGFFLMGTSVIKEQAEEQEVYFGRVPVLGLMVHESAHSTMGNTRGVIASKVVQEFDLVTGDRFNHWRFNSSEIGGMRKYGLSRQGRAAYKGDFFEEAFADLHRVRALGEFGFAPIGVDDMILKTDDPELNYYGDTANMPEQNNPAVTMVPTSFAQAVSVLPDNRGVAVWSNASGIAAYGLDLLDRQAPGLFEQMNDARKDPAKYREVIKTVNSIRPNLYRDLRDLSYKSEDFREGLAVIKEALAQAAAPFPE